MVKKIFLPLLGVFAFWGCENPYVVQDLKRPVTLTMIEFHTDRDDLEVSPAALKPVFNSAVTDYTAMVNELAEKVFPVANPETGAMVIFGNAVNERGVSVPLTDGYYQFPGDITEMNATFTVIKNYRRNGPYNVRILRRMEPGKLKSLRISVAWYDPDLPGASDKSVPTDPGWVYETQNCLANFDPSGFSYNVGIPYYAEKILIEPEIDPGIAAAYRVYPANPQYFPDGFEPRPGNPQGGHTWEPVATGIINYINDPAANGPDYTYPLHRQLNAGKAPVDPATGQETSWLVIHTVMEDRETGEQRDPRDYTFKLVWDKSYAYLRPETGLDLRDDRTPAEKKLLGNFIVNIPDYEAEVHEGTEKITVHTVPKNINPTSTVKVTQWNARGGVQIGPERSQTGGTFPFSPEFDFPSGSAGMKETFIRVEVENPQLFSNPETNYGRYTYWITVRRREPPARLLNFRIEGKVSGTWLSLFEFDKDGDGRGYDSNSIPASPPGLLTLEEPKRLPPYTLDDETNFTMEVDGAMVTELRFTGVPEAGGTVKYNVGDDLYWPPARQDFVFSGGIGVSITASLPGYKDRVYAFTIIRAGAMVVELYTDKRVPSTTLIPHNPATFPASSDPQPNINDDERGSFQAIVNGRAVNNVLPTKEVILRVTPKLGWKVDGLWLINENGSASTLDSFAASGLGGSGPYSPDPVYSPDTVEWKFIMPARKLAFLLQYDFVTGAVDRVAYVAPEGKAGRSDPYGVDKNGKKPGDSGYDPSTAAGSCWAYATSNLQGVIDEFDEPGTTGPFAEIWLHEGTYRLDPNRDAGRDWAEEIPAGYRGDQKNRSFVLKRGLRVYGGFKGKEGIGGLVDTLKKARGLRQADTAAAQRTILSGMLSDSSTHVRHVVIAADIGSPCGDDTSAAGRGAPDAPDKPGPTGYGFNPAEDSTSGIFGGDGVTLLDTLSIRDGLRTKDSGSLTVRGETVYNRFGAGLYNADASPYLHNVTISDNTAVRGGGMYSAGGYPVLKDVRFTNNDATGYENQGGDGAGFANAGGLAAILGCEFRNNSTVGGDGAGIHVSGGSVMLRRSNFRYNSASAGGGVYNGAHAWIYEGIIENNDAFDSGSGIQNGGTLRLVNVDVTNNRISGGIANGGILSAANLTVSGHGTGLSSGGSLALTNSRITGNGTGLAASSGATALANVLIDGNSGAGLSFHVSDGNRNGPGYVTGGCVLTNVTIRGNGTGISAGFSSSYTFNQGAANLLLNGVRISGNGTGMTVSQSSPTGGPDGKKGVYVTLDNVTIAGNSGAGLTTSTANGNMAAGPDYDVLDMRIRNSFIQNNGTQVPTSPRRAVGAMGASGSYTEGPDKTLILSPDKADLFPVGQTFRIAGGGPEGTLKPSINTVTVQSGNTITFTATHDFSYTAGDYIILSGWSKIFATLDASAPAFTLNSGKNTLKLQPGQIHPFIPNMQFKFAYPNGTPKSSISSINTVITVTADPGGDVIIFTATQPETCNGGDKILLASDDSEILELDPSTPSAILNTPASNTLVLPAAAGLPALDTMFRFARPANTAPETSVNTVTGTRTNLNPGFNAVIFTATAPDSIGAGDHIVMNDVIPKIGPIGQTLVVGSHSLTIGTGTNKHLSPFQASLLSVGDVFHFVSPGGALKGSARKITAVGPAAVTFTPGGGGYSAGDFIIPENKYVNLAGHVTWDNSMAGLADRTVTEGSFIPGTGKTAAVYDGDFRVTDSDLKDRGDNSYHPADAADLADQCFERYTGKGGGDGNISASINGAKTGMTNLLGLWLRTWSGTPASGTLSTPVSVDVFLVKDNGFNQGDLRDPQSDGTAHNRVNGTIDVGAYEN